MTLLPEWIKEITRFIETHTLIEASTDFSTDFHLYYLPDDQLYVHFVDSTLVKGNHEHYFFNLYQQKAKQKIRLITIWEDQYIHYKKVIQSRLLSSFGKTHKIHARVTEVRQLNQTELDDFLTQHHLQGSTKAKHKFGLFYKGELVSVASFSKACPIDRDQVRYRSHELIRFCNKTGSTVVGGLSKLIAHFVKKHKPEDIMTYADCDWGLGKGYEKIGFQLIEHTPARAFYIDKVNFKRHWTMSSQLPIQFTKAFNAGSLKYILFLK